MARLGTVPYLNALPLVEGLADEPGLELVREVPSRLVTRLRSGELDAALVSSVELFRDPPLDWLTVAGVTSEGPVESILLFCRTAPADITSLALDSSSRSAAVMTQVCLTRFLGASPQRVCEAAPDAPLPSLDADAVLRIGDPALATDPAGREVLDLGELWTASTGLPFVYAAWLARRGADLTGVAQALGRARDLGLARRDELARAFAERHDHDPERSVRYLAEAIGFRLGAREREGLALFGELAAACGLVDHGRLRAPLDPDPV
jgi:chorismate dehydratase